MSKKKIKELRNVNELINPICGEIGTAQRQKFTDDAISLYYGELIKEQRIAKHMTQVELADLAGTKRNHISRIENGKTDLRVSTMYRIAKVLNLELVLK